ncbi:hypothetical protein ACH3O9_11340 [Leeuwenhoekiella sp. A16]|uniref:hypothetical protein n=1 Tax=Leeuwenhoekiella sp. A16 TaxID=3141462 RepID=UPI003A805A44
MKIEDPNIKVKIKHSVSNKAWNIVGTGLGCKYKVARIPYYEIEGHSVQSEIEKSEALRHAKFIEYCFNNSKMILDKIEVQ